MNHFGKLKNVKSRQNSNCEGL